MKTTNKIAIFAVMSVMTGVLVVLPSEAEAWIFTTGHSGPRIERRNVGHHNRNVRQYPYYPQGRIVFGLPHGVISISVGGAKYHYHEGRYYHKSHYGYEVVRAPIGACIRKLPFGYKIVREGQYKYYTYDGVYYQQTPQGYLVVPEPELVVVKTSNVYKAPSVSNIDIQNTSFTINVPNGNGSYTPVLITQTDNGFIGPQGELYSEFPKIAQLKVMYGS